MKVGTVVKLKKACLGNEVGTVGVVYENYCISQSLRGASVIFKNGNYDGFSFESKMPGGLSEVDFFLETVGFDTTASCYQFENVLRLERDFRSGIFDKVLNTVI